MTANIANEFCINIWGFCESPQYQGGTFAFTNPTPKDNHNLSYLFRSKASRHKVVDGKLLQWSFFDEPSCFDCIFNCQRVEPNQTTVKDTINSLIGRLRLAEFPNEAELTRLFFDKLPRYGREIYNPALIHSSIRKGLIQSQRFQNLYAIATQDIGDLFSPEKKKKKHFLAAVKETLFALTLGIKPETPGGATESYKLRSLQGHPLAIFKPTVFNDWTVEHKPILKRIKIVVSWAFCLSGSLMDVPSSLSECATYIVGKHMGKGKNTVKETALVTLRVGKEEYKGSYQLWEQRPHLDAKSYFGLNKYYGGIPQRTIPRKLFERMVILDVLTGNMDRHAENWLIILNKKNEPVDVVTVDGGKSMSCAHSDAILEWRNQYIWKLMTEYSELPFSKEACDTIHEIYNGQEDLFVELFDFYLRYQREPSSMALIRCRMEKVRERLEVLHHFALEGKKLNELASIRTSYEFSRALSEMRSQNQQSCEENLPSSENVVIGNPTLNEHFEIEAGL